MGLNFLEHRGDASAFEPAPGDPDEAPAAPAPAAPARPSDGPERYTVSVDGRDYDVVVSPAGDIAGISPAGAPAPQAAAAEGDAVEAPLAGSVFRILVKPGQQVATGDILVIMEAMKMETEVRSPKDGTVTAVAVQEGDSVELGHALVYVA